MLLYFVQGLVIMFKDLALMPLCPGGDLQKWSAMYFLDQRKKIQVIFDISWLHIDVSKLLYLQNPIR